MTPCEHAGCEALGCITLEVVWGRGDDDVSVRRLCVEHAEAAEAEAVRLGHSDRRTHVEPVAGLPCTFCVGSDRYPGQVVAVKGAKRIVVQRVCYSANAAAGHDYFGGQKWLIHFDQPEGDEKVYTLRSNGRWVQVGVDAKYGDLVLGHARAYSDPHF
jgi:hypothetical protein